MASLLLKSVEAELLDLQKPSTYSPVVLLNCYRCNQEGAEVLRTTYSLSMLSWRGRKTGKIGIHLTENGSNQRHVIFDGR